MRATIIIAAALLLQGCAAGMTNYADSAVTRKQPASSFQAGNGVVLLSMAQSDYRADSVLFGEYDVDQDYTWTFDVRRLDSGQMYRFRGGRSLFEGLTFGLVDNDDIAGGHVFAHSLPPGDYAFVNFRVHHIQGMPTGTIEQSWSPRAEFSVPFTVASGGVHYLGEWRCIPQSADGLLGLTVRAGCVWEVSDRFARDTPILKQRYPDFAWDHLSNDTLQSRTAPAQIVTFK